MPFGNAAAPASAAIPCNTLRRLIEPGVAPVGFVMFVIPKKEKMPEPRPRVCRYARLA
jgi:hypothetical protein